jgi:hypothetical protein
MAELARSAGLIARRSRSVMGSTLLDSSHVRVSYGTSGCDGLASRENQLELVILLGELSLQDGGRDSRLGGGSEY